MRLAAVGVGNAGSRIVNRVRGLETSSGRNLCNGNTLIINSTTPSFATSSHVPEERRMTIGDAYWEVDRSDIEGDPDVAAEVASEERKDIIRAFDLIEFHEVDGVLVVASLAGGTGGGAGAAVIEMLQDISDVPVYAVGVLPEASEGERPALIAARSLQSFVAAADNVVLFDNEAWLADDDSPVEVPDGDEDAADDATGESADDGAEDATGDAADDGAEDGEPDDDEIPPEERYDTVNEILAEQLVTLFATGTFGGGSIPDDTMDPSDIIRTLDTGGISSIGYASVDLPRTGTIAAVRRELRDRLARLSNREFSWLPDEVSSRLSEHEPAWLPDREVDDEADGATDAEKINGLVRRATRSKLTLPCDVASADRALIALSGPSETLSRKGFENGRYWLEREADVVDVVAGDRPHDGSSSLTAVVLFANVTGVPRIEAMQEAALDHQQSPGTEGANYGKANPR